VSRTVRWTLKRIKITFLTSIPMIRKIMLNFLVVVLVDCINHRKYFWKVCLIFIIFVMMNMSMRFISCVI